MKKCIVIIAGLLSASYCLATTIQVQSTKSLSINGVAPTITLVSNSNSVSFKLPKAKREYGEYVNTVSM